MPDSLTPPGSPCQTLQNTDDLASVSPRHAVWDKRKAEGDTVSEILTSAPDMNKRSQRIRDCSDHLILKRSTDTATGQTEAEAHSAKCKDRACPICQQARSVILKQELSGAFTHLLKDHPKSRFLFVTFTVRNCPVTELKVTLARMNSAFNGMTQTVLFKTRVQGWTRTTEVTRGKDETAHPHFHCILVVKPSYFSGQAYITQAAWAELWQKALDVDYRPVIDIRAVKEIEGALLEVSKISGYSVKVDGSLHQHADWFIEYQRQVKGSRFFAAGGLVKRYLKAVRKPETGDDIVEPLSQGSPDVETTVTVFDWNRPVKRYKKRKKEGAT